MAPGITLCASVFRIPLPLGGLGYWWARPLWSKIPWGHSTAQLPIISSKGRTSAVCTYRHSCLLHSLTEVWVSLLQQAVVPSLTPGRTGRCAPQGWQRLCCPFAATTMRWQSATYRKLMQKTVARNYSGKTRNNFLWLFTYSVSWMQQDFLQDNQPTGRIQEKAGGELARHWWGKRAKLKGV